MSIEDRDYYRFEPAPYARSAPAISITAWLIGINVAIYVVDQLFQRIGLVAIVHGQAGQLHYGNPIETLGFFSFQLAIRQLELWRFLSFQFLHANLTHLLFNMFGLFFFGPLIETYLGRSRFLAFYLLCGIGGPVAYVLLWMFHFLGSADAPLVGASAGIFGILIAASQIAPEATVLLYGIIPMKLRTLAWLLLAIAVFTVLRYGESGLKNSGGEAAHLGGAAVGYILIHNPQFLRKPKLDFLRRRPPPF